MTEWLVQNHIFACIGALFGLMTWLASRFVSEHFNRKKAEFETRIRVQQEEVAQLRLQVRAVREEGGRVRQSLRTDPHRLIQDAFARLEGGPQGTTREALNAFTQDMERLSQEMEQTFPGTTRTTTTTYVVRRYPAPAATEPETQPQAQKAAAPVTPAKPKAPKSRFDRLDEDD